MKIFRTFSWKTTRVCEWNFGIYKVEIANWIILIISANKEILKSARKKTRGWELSKILNIDFLVRVYLSFWSSKTCLYYISWPLQTNKVVKSDIKIKLISMGKILRYFKWFPRSVTKYMQIIQKECKLNRLMCFLNISALFQFPRIHNP